MEDIDRAISLTKEAYYLVEDKNLYLAKQKLNQALVLYELPDTHNELGLIYALQGDNVSALNHALCALQLAPESSKFYNSVAQCLVNMNRTDESLPYVNKALEIDPLNASAHKLKAKILYTLDLNDAKKHHYISKSIYNNTGKRSDGTPLRKTDLEDFYSLKNKWINIPESKESFEIRNINWLFKQIFSSKNLIKNIHIYKSLYCTFLRWLFVIFIPIFTTIGVLVPNSYLIDNRLVIFLLGFVVVGLTELIFELRNLFRSDLVIIPYFYTTILDIIKGFGFSAISYSFGTIAHKAYGNYEIVIAILSGLVLLKAIIRRGRRHGFYYSRRTHPDNYSINNNIYTNSEYGFSIKIPDKWDVANSRNSFPGVLVDFHNASNDYDVSINVAINVIYSSTSDSFSRLEKANIYVNRIIKNRKKNETVETIYLDLGDDLNYFPAIKVDYQFFGRRHRKIGFFLKTLPFGGHEYLITYGAPPEKFYLYEKEFEETVKTIHIT